MATIFNKRKTNNNAEMSFTDHLEALRWHVVRSVAAILVVAILVFLNIDWIFDNIILGPINPNFISYKGLCDFSHWAHLGDAFCMPPIQVEMQATAFGTQFMSTITIGILAGFILAFPYIFWEFWRFVAPGLKESEIKGTRFTIFWVSFFFFLGAAFGYFLLAPFTFNFLASFEIGSMHLLKTRPTLDDYLENLTDIILGCGIAFELPVISYVLTRIGLITPSFLQNSRKFAIVIILVVAAVITPSPDWISQLIVFIPLFMLYELSILISKKVQKEEKVKEEKEWS